MTHVGHELSKLTVRRFLLRRDKDVSGISGLGHVAEGCTFTDGTTILRWHSGQSTAIYPSPEAVEKIHGHGTGTVIEWIDDGLERRQTIIEDLLTGEVKAVFVDEPHKHSCERRPCCRSRTCEYHEIDCDVGTTRPEDVHRLPSRFRRFWHTGRAA